MKNFYLLFSALLLTMFSFAQIQLPLDFESATANYTFTDFAGGATTKIANPQINGINTSANVAKMVKGTGEVYGGSTITLTNPIDFSVNKTFKIKVFSPRVGAKLLLKIENASNGAINFEKEVLSTVANAWEDLTFDYSAISTTNQYSKLVFIFDNGTAGNGTANYTWLFDDVRLVASTGGGGGGGTSTLPVLPLDFESATINYAFTDFGGGATTKIANPQISGINTSANVGKMVKGLGEVYGGSVITLAAPIDFSVNKTFKVKVFSPRVGAKLLLKVENATDGSINFQKEATSTVANAWEDLTFDYTTISTTNQYSKLVFIFDLGTAGDGTANYTWLFDEVRLVTSGGGGGGGLTQMNLPVTFDDATVNYGLVGFAGAEQSTIVADPTLATNKVAKVIKTNTAELYAGTTITAQSGAVQTGFSSNIPFTATEKRMNVRVYSPHAGIQVRLKVEDKNDPTHSCETEATVTTANGWQTLEFNFANQAAGTAALNIAYSLNKATIFFNFGVTGAVAGERTYYFDDVKFGAATGGGGGTSTLPVLPLDFESATLNYTFTDFGGGATTKIANPQISGINTSANVAKMVKGPKEVYGGSVITLAAPIDFSVNKTFKVKVFSPRVGAKLLLKVENATDGTINFQQEATSTVANAWEDLTFDYSAISTTNQYSKLVFIFDLGTAGDGTANYTWLFDEVRLAASGGGGGGSLTQMTLPVTFDDATVNYGLVGFAGAEQSTIVADPTLATNKVAKVIKTITAELYAGTTITAQSGALQTGFSSNIPFTATEKRMNVRVYSPHAGIQVRLKVEDKNDPTHSCETEATVTTANGWQTLEFNFANQAAGTAALNLAYSLNKATIFFNFGVTGAVAGQQIYYFDDVKFGAALLPPAPPAPIVTSPIIYCQNSIAAPLSATALAGNILSWYTVAANGTASATAPTPSTTAAGTTNYYVSQKTSAGVEGPRATITVTVNTAPLAPTVSTPLLICLNAQSSSLTATAAIGNTLNWYTVAMGDIGVINAPTTVTSTAGSVTYYVSQTNNLGCEGLKAALIVTIVAPPAPPVIATTQAQITPGQTTTIAAANPPGSGNTYSWFRNGIVITAQSGNSIPVNIDGVGSYTLKVTSALGCVSTSNTVNITEANSNKLFVYPNPSNGKFQVRYFTDPNNLQPLQIAIYNSLGALIFSGKYTSFSSYSPMNIDLTKHGNGVYHLKMMNAGGKIIATETIIVHK